MVDTAQANVQPQYSQIYTLAVQPGIKRDGTIFESREFSDGEWCRFQRGTPKKMGGYREIFSEFNGIARGMIMNAYNGINYVFTGNQYHIDVFTTGTTIGLGAGPFQAVINQGYSELAITITGAAQFTVAPTPATNLTTLFKPGAVVAFSQNATVFYTVASSSFSTPTTTVNLTTNIAGSPTSVWSYDYSYRPGDARNLWQWDMQYSPLGDSLKVLGHPGLNLVNVDNAVPTQVLIGDLLPNSNNQWEFNGLADTGGQNPTYQAIAVSGGVCVLYPYTFVYGSNGYIANNNVSGVYGEQNIADWNGATANQVNMAAAKIVKGMPVRGGTNSPSGLFWASDSLIRVSFTGAAPLYWRYDIISNQTSIMSSSSVVEMDGTFFWLGVDRFYLYNGNVSVLPNDKNLNWLFDNINLEQRQKVWTTKVPRYNEIWFFYPRGTATECTDAIIYNVKDKIWYDAGSAIGAQRSCGYTTEVFPTPIWANWNYDVYYGATQIISATPAGEPAPNANQFYLEGDLTPSFSPGAQIQIGNVVGNPTYTIIASIFIFNLTIGGAGATLVTCEVDFDPSVAVGDDVYVVTGGYGFYQHEFGLNRINLQSEFAITSTFTTCDVSWVGGTPSEDTSVGVNRRMHFRRLEPDFVQNGTLELSIIGDKFARGTTEISGPFYFEPNTGKIDLRVEHREARLQFVSNEIDGNYEMGRILLTIEYGDERP